MSNKVLVFLGLWALLTLLESFFPADSRQRIFSTQTFTDGLCLFVNKVLLQAAFTTLTVLLPIYLLEPYAPHHMLKGIIDKAPLALQFIAAIFLIDLAQYLRHRLTHWLLWSCHATHHSAVELRASVHWRVHPVDMLFIAAFDTVFLYILGFGGGVIALSQIFMSLHNMWLHANLNVDYGPLRKVLVSPNYHKWHHAKEKGAIDKNFADLFVFLDLLGGTHYYPHQRRPEAYGVHDIAEDAPLHRHFIGAMIYPVTQLREWLAARGENEL